MKNTFVHGSKRRETNKGDGKCHGVETGFAQPLSAAEKLQRV